MSLSLTDPSLLPPPLTLTSRFLTLLRDQFINIVQDNRQAVGLTDVGTDQSELRNHPDAFGYLRHIPDLTLEDLAHALEDSGLKLRAGRTRTAAAAGRRILPGALP